MRNQCNSASNGDPWALAPTVNTQYKFAARYWMPVYLELYQVKPTSLKYSQQK